VRNGHRAHLAFSVGWLGSRKPSEAELPDGVRRTRWILDEFECREEAGQHSKPI